MSLSSFHSFVFCSAIAGHIEIRSKIYNLPCLIINVVEDKGATIHSFSPVDGKFIGSVICGDKNDYHKVMFTAGEAFQIWRTWPAPKRGEVVRQIGEAFLLGSCSKKEEAVSKEHTFDFNESRHGWDVLFSDYPVGEEGLYELSFEHTRLPAPIDNSVKSGL